MRFLFIFLLITTFSGRAFSQETTAEETAIKAMMLYCMPPIVTREDVADFAVKNKLPELPKEKAILFNKEGGRVFAIPQLMGNAVLIAAKVPGVHCSIALRTGNADLFWSAADIFFGKETPFKVFQEQTLSEGGKRKNLEADFHGPTLLILSMRDKPVSEGMQGLMTFSRYKK